MTIARLILGVAGFFIGLFGFIGCEGGSSPDCHCDGPRLSQGVHMVQSVQYSDGDATSFSKVSLDDATVDVDAGKLVVSYRHDGEDVRVTYRISVGP